MDPDAYPELIRNLAKAPVDDPDGLLLNQPMISQGYTDEHMIRDVGIALMVLALAFAVLSLLDNRVLPNGEDVWMKPLRFAAAFAVRALTLWWISVFTKRQANNDMFFSWSVRITAVVMVIELILIAIQGARGVPSHFNYATEFDRQIFSWMGIGTIGLFAGLISVFIGQIRRPLSAITTVAVNSGVILAILGGLVGVWMVIPTESQRLLLDQGATLDWIGGHAVGVQSGEQVPLFSWNRSGGDWRVAHFIGIHGLQALPLLGFLAMQLNTPTSRSWRALALAVAGMSGLLLWACYQTYSGYSLFLPELRNVIVVGASIAILFIGYAMLVPRRTQKSLDF